MENEIKEFDLTEHIRNKIRNVLVESIPDNQMDAMIKNEYNNFFAKRITYNNESPSRFQELVSGVLEAELRKKLKDWLDINFQVTWDEGNIPQLLNPMIDKLTPVVLNRIAQSIVAAAINEIRNGIVNFR